MTSSITTREPMRLTHQNVEAVFADCLADSAAHTLKGVRIEVAFITIDEKTAAEKRTASVIMVQASDFDNALANFKDGMKGTMADFEIISIAETNIMDVYKAKLDK